jgi:predicted transcriptional regulator of viral defense system
MVKHNPIHSTAGIELVRKLAEQGTIIFTSKEAIEVAIPLGISTVYFRQVLHHLERSNWIIRLKNGLYSLSSSVPGVSPLHEFQIAMALVHPAAISHWSALNYHGITEQVPQRIFVLTTAQSLPRLRGAKRKLLDSGGYPVGKAIFQFVQIKPEHFFGIEEVWVNDAKIKITDIERTFLDCLMFPEYCGGFFEVLHFFERRLAKLNIKKIIEYALKLDTATIKRLGWILEYQGIDYSMLETLQKTPIKGYRLLDKSGLHEGKYNSKWMIQENISGK